MARTYVAMTDLLKIELTGCDESSECFACRVYKLINRTWHYLDSAPTTLTVDSSDGQIREMMASLAASYTDTLGSVN